MEELRRQSGGTALHAYESQALLEVLEMPAPLVAGIAAWAVLPPANRQAARNFANGALTQSTAETSYDYFLPSFNFKAEIDGGSRPGTTTTDAERLHELEREVKELRRANAILKSASAFFAAELYRPSR